MPASTPHTVSVPSGRTVIYGGVAAPIPTWLSAIEVGHWGAVGANTLAAVDPEDDAAVNPTHPADAPWHAVQGLAGMLNGWSGGAYDTTNHALYIWGGGHLDYAGNEVYRFNASLDSPTFERLTDPTGAIGNTGVLNDGQEPSGEYFDGRPRSFHTYGHLMWISGELYCAPAGSPYAGGGFNLTSWKFNPTTLAWTKLTSRPGGQAYGGSVYAASRGEVWSFAASRNGPHKYVPATDTWTTEGLDFEAGTYVRPVYDPVGDLIILFRTGYGTANAAYIDLNAYAIPVNITATGTAPSTTAAGVEYDAARDCFWVWIGGADLYKLSPPAVGDRKSGTWTWETVAPGAGNTVTPSAPADGGTFGRFWLDPEYDCVGVVNDVTGPMYVRRLS